MRNDWELTGNHYLAVPCLSPVDGGIHHINVVSARALGLVGWAGDRLPELETPLLVPRFSIDGERVDAGPLKWERLDRWIPRFRTELPGGITVQGTLCFPGVPDRRFTGGVYTFRVENAGKRDVRVEVALEGVWRWSLRTVRSSRPLRGENAVWRGDAGIALETPPPAGGAALALIASGKAVYAAAAEGDALEELPSGDELVAPNGGGIALRVSRAVRVPKGGRGTASFFLAAAPERDGALARCQALRDLGADAILHEARLELARLERRVRDPALGAILNRHLYFAYFFGLARAIDDDRLYPLRSRSPLRNGAAIVNEGDLLLRLLPAVNLADGETAREALLRVFEQLSQGAGRHSHYIDGGLVDPRFVLDHYCAYVVALDRYVTETQDRSILEEPPVQDVLREIDAGLFGTLDQEAFLASTEATPSGERPAYPFSVAANVLLWKVCDALPRIWIAAGPEDVPRLRGAADEAAAAIWRYGTAEIDGLRILAWSVDIDGSAAVYDDPSASLMALPALGFCSVDEPVWRNTMDLLASDSYPYMRRGAFPGRSTRLLPEAPATAALCADLIGPGGEAALQLLRRMRLPAGLVAEAYDAETGEPVGEHYDAALAGFMSTSLWEALELPPKTR